MVMYNKHVQHEQARNQSSLFSMSDDVVASKVEMRAVDPIPSSLLLTWEKELLGLYISSHPAKLFYDQFSSFVAKASSIPTMEDDAVVKIAGVISAVKQIFTKKKNEPMAFVRIEDPSGSIEVVVFPKLYVRIRTKLNPDAMVVIMGKVSQRKREESENVEFSILADEMLSFTEPDIPRVARMLQSGSWTSESDSGSEASAPAPTPAAAYESRSTPTIPISSGLSIVVPANPTHDMISKLRDIFRASPGRAPVFLLVESGGSMRKVTTEYSVDLSRSVIDAVGGVVGKENVKV